VRDLQISKQNGMWYSHGGTKVMCRNQMSRLNWTLPVCCGLSFLFFPDHAARTESKPTLREWAPEESGLKKNCRQSIDRLRACVARR